MAVRLVRRRFTVDEYYRMAEAGILDEDDRVELLEGVYARYGIGEVWVVDLQRRGVDVYRTPAPDGYRSVQRTAGGDLLTVEALPDLAFQAQDLLI
ncbi:MAG: Uma2 family endonuclease [Armatimonadota bacterium]|nr:Uma2 family endonuclease [Armatimonadota bacterium]MDR7479497.1 Uma2 family endonuclease [Armatimonadota bacterium]MDR7526640.1 Uma2 family endonuclease [Armatimonadota bacterium]MDR7543925.1 Uma2 family endonuclease [Armatimonadota bacterium]MDR7573975.1 Uma2 family endonuclease [Armatimonadota bacterium]